MSVPDSHYFINNPIFLKFKSRFNFLSWKKEKYLKSVFVNERIIEVPFAISAVSRLPKGSAVLDLGCTESTLPLQLAGLGYKVTGFDFREYPYPHPNLRTAQGDMLQLPFSAETFDAALSISTVEHAGIGFYKDPKEVAEADRKAVAEVRRVLKKGGTFVLTVPFGRPQVNRHQRVYGEEALEALLSGFLIEERRYFAACNKEGTRSNFWEEVPVKQAAQVDSGESTRAVCLVRART